MMFFGLFGGLALFLFGMRTMSDGLQNAAGDRMQGILGRVTRLPILGVLVGALVTLVIQSSSATTVMVISFVNAGLLNLTQAIGVIMGTNIGTTVTAQLIAFDLTDLYLPLIVVGFFVGFFVKKASLKYFGQFMFGFGVLLMGLSFMAEAMAPLRDMPAFQDFIVRYGDIAVLGLLIGILITVVIQSSSAAMGILLALSFNDLIPLDTAIAVILGFNVGTCVTAILASIGLQTTAKRAAAAHLIFNVLGAVLCLLFLPLFSKLVLAVTPGDHMPQLIANAHTLFNVINTIIFLPFVAVIARIVTRLVPEKKLEEPAGATFLDERMLGTPSAAMNLATEEVLQMGAEALAIFDMAMRGLIDGNVKKAETVLEAERRIDRVTREVSEYLAKISRHELTEEQSQDYVLLHHVLNDFERISDLCENIAELTQTAEAEGISFSDQGLIDLKEMSRLVSENIERAVAVLVSRNKKEVAAILAVESEIDNLEQAFRIRHIARFSDGLCQPHAGIVFLDVISNLERIGDHVANIAREVKNVLA